MAKAASRPAISDWGIPDPRDAVAYPVAATWPHWGWQFLRRRRDYRRRWEEVVRPYLTDDGGWDLEKEDRDGNEEAERAYQERRPFHWRHPFVILQDEFKVCSSTLPRGNAALDPRLDQPPVFEGTFVTEVLFQRQAVPSKPAIEIDPQLPLEPQLAAAREFFRLRVQALPPPLLQVGKFPSYLRILDFEACDVLHKEIGQSLFPNFEGEPLRGRIRDTLKAAHHLQDGYLYIALKSVDS